LKQAKQSFSKGIVGIKARVEFSNAMIEPILNYDGIIEVATDFSITMSVKYFKGK
jgi:hypothetical protein